MEKYLAGSMLFNKDATMVIDITCTGDTSSSYLDSPSILPTTIGLART